MTMARLTDRDVADLYGSSAGAVLLRDVLQYVFSPQDEEMAVAAIAARVLDERAVCHVIGPARTIDCRSPPHANGMAAIAWMSPTSCLHCNQTIVAADLPAGANSVLDALRARSDEPPLPGDALIFMTGPAVVTETTCLRILAPSWDDPSAFFIDKEWGQRPVLGYHPRAAMIDRASAAPFVSDTANCHTAPTCWVDGPNSRCVCDK